PQLPTSISRELSKLRGHLRRRDLTIGLARTGLALCAFVLGTFVLDRLLEFPAPFRAVMLACGVGGVGFLAWRHLLRPLAHSRSDDEIALLIERAHPELNDELISAVQLSRRRGKWDSPELVSEVVAGAASRAKSIDASRVAQTGDASRLVLLTLGIAVIVGG